MNFLIVIISIVLWFPSEAADQLSNPCNELPSKSKEISRLNADSNITIITCGEREVGNVSDLTILKVQGSQVTSLLVGDAAFKSYAIQKQGLAFVITESLNENDAKPFLKIKVSCEKKICRTEESCIWVKSKPEEEAILKIQRLQKKSNANAITDTLWTRAFYAAINRSTNALKLFELSGSANFDAAGGEAFETYKSDLLRLKRAKCL